LEILEFYYESKNKYLYADAEAEAIALLKYLRGHEKVTRVELTGEIRRKCEVIKFIEIIISIDPKAQIKDLADEKELHLIYEGGAFKSPLLEIPIHFYEADEINWIEQLIITTGNKEHISKLGDHTIKNASSEEEVYSKNNYPYIIPEMREGLQEFEVAASIETENIIDFKMLKGCLHNHSTWSDGSNSIMEMAAKCQELGLEYFGIADHSQAAFYANGLKPAALHQQWREIDKLNNSYKGFKIFKGTEADILSDGDLDYDTDLLSGFDYVVGSVHSRLKMNKQEATKRLLKAIENPFITILGHMTARLLLMRKGFEVDYKKVIDACAANAVSIEINANPRRLDMDWKQLYYAIDKEIMISINPDAHDVSEISNMYYGVCVSRKVGLQKDQVLNTFPLVQIETYFNKKKSSRP
jgi:DNA polymerase (family 10)